MDSAAVFALDTNSGKVQRKASMRHARFDVALAAAPNNYTNGVLYSVGGGIHNTTKDGHQVPLSQLCYHISSRLLHSFP